MATTRCNLDETLDPKQLAERLHLSPRTLANWRSLSTELNPVGPRYIKLHGRVLYALADVLIWERSNTAYRYGTEPGD